MSTVTAADGTGSVEARIVFPFEQSYRSRNVVHELISGDIALTLLAPLPQSGTLTFEATNEANAVALRNLHRKRTTFVLAVPERPTAGITYAVTGDIRMQMHETGRWTVTVGYQAVS